MLQMTSYEEFCSQSLAKLQMEEKSHLCQGIYSEQETPSLIQFYGMPVLSPLLNEKQRMEMSRYRSAAVQLETEKQTPHKTKLVLHESPEPSDDPLPSIPPSQKTNVCNISSLFDKNDSYQETNASSLDLGFNKDLLKEELPCVTGPYAGEEESKEETLELQSSISTLSLHALLKKSREYLEKEVGLHGSWGMGKSLGCTSSTDRDEHVSPVSALSCLPHSFTSSYVQFPSPEPSLSPPPHRRHSRPNSAGNILISCPLNASELSMGTSESCDEQDPVVVPWADESCASSAGNEWQSKTPEVVCTTGPIPRHSSTMDSILCSPCHKPYFMRDVLQRSPCRRSPPAPLNKSYNVKNPSPALQRPHVSPGHSCVEMEGSPRTRDCRLVQKHLTAAREDPTCPEAENNQEQEREQHLLRQDPKKNCARGQGGELTQKSVDERCPALSPIYRVRNLTDRSPGHGNHGRGFSPVLSPVYMGSRSKGRLLQVATPDQQKALSRLAAIAQGFFIRRLLNTEKLKHLRQTVRDTKEFICTFNSEIPFKTGLVSSNDFSLQKRVKAQMQVALFDVHYIFFVAPLAERLALLRQDRELRAERRLREVEKNRSPKDKGVTLSAATQKSLDRKKRRLADSLGQGKRIQLKPESPSTNRVLRPNQGQNTPVASTVLRQGPSRKAPEERVSRTSVLRKRHSLM